MPCDLSMRSEIMDDVFIVGTGDCDKVDGEEEEGEAMKFINDVDPHIESETKPTGTDNEMFKDEQFFINSNIAL